MIMQTLAQVALQQRNKTPLHTAAGAIDMQKRFKGARQHVLLQKRN